MLREIKTPPHVLVRKIETNKFKEYNIKGTTLDGGCGDGTFARAILPNENIIGVDLYKLRLMRAKKLLNGVVMADLRHLPFINGAFDNVVSNSTLEHVKGHIGQVIREFALVSRELYVCVPSKIAHKLTPKGIFNIHTNMTEKEWRIVVSKCGVTNLDVYSFIPLVFQAIYYTAFVLPIFKLPKILTVRIKNGVLIFIQGKSEFNGKKFYKRRIRIRGHYRTVIRDEKGRIVSSKKWSSKK
jgi:SAM-dependent methyltransferase